MTSRACTRVRQSIHQPPPAVDWSRYPARFAVHGAPMGKGSPEARFVPNLGHVVKHERRPVVNWETLVKRAAQDHIPPGGPLQGPVAAALVFHMPRPKSARKSAIYPATKPDCDKLLRAIGDALTHVLYQDDAQLCWFDVLGKVYCGDGETPRVEIGLRSLEEGQA